MRVPSGDRDGHSTFSSIVRAVRALTEPSMTEVLPPVVIVA
jgi:hypothetical protein